MPGYTTTDSTGDWGTSTNTITIDCGSGTASTDTDTVWLRWCADSTGTSSTSDWLDQSFQVWTEVQEPALERRRLTKAEKAARRTREQLRRLGRELVAAVRESQAWLPRLVHGIKAAVRKSMECEAANRARALLHVMLTGEQRHTLEHKGYIPVFVEGKVDAKLGRYYEYGSKKRPSTLPERREYRIRAKGRHGNIERYENGKRVESLCVAPSGPMPEADAWTGQLLFLQHAEDELRQRANITLH